MIIKMVDRSGPYKTGSLPSTITPEQIIAVLGSPNISDDEEKVTYSWGFTIDGELCGIWDFKGTRWSTFGPTNKILELLGKGGTFYSPSFGDMAWIDSIGEAQ